MADRLIGRRFARSTGGGRGIRTREGLPPTRSPGVPLRPLGQATVAQFTRAGRAAEQASKVRRRRRDSGNTSDQALSTANRVASAHLPRNTRSHPSGKLGGESSGFLNRVSQVRFLPGALPKTPGQQHFPALAGNAPAVWAHLPLAPLRLVEQVVTRQVGHEQT